MKLAYVVQGIGEFSQAESFAFFARKKGDTNIFITDDAVITRACREDGFETIRSKNTQETQKIISALRPDVLFLCNSKTVFMYEGSIMKEAPLVPRPLIASFDSNWLFSSDPTSPYPVPSWLDLVIITMPERIFQQGMLSYGGHYQLDPSWQKKIFCAGFIPSGKKVSAQERKEKRNELKLVKDEKFIFSYFGMREKNILPHYLRALETFIPQYEQQGKKVRAFVKLKEKMTMKRHPWLMTTDWVSHDDFVTLLAASDLVVLHHGLGTFPKVIHNQVPTLCIVPKVGNTSPLVHSPTFEIQAFEGLNLCQSIPYGFSMKSFHEALDHLLFDTQKVSRMKKSQGIHFQAGEENAHAKIKQMVRERKKRRI